MKRKFMLEADEKEIFQNISIYEKEYKSLIETKNRIQNNWFMVAIYIVTLFLLILLYSLTQSTYLLIPIGVVILFNLFLIFKKCTLILAENKKHKEISIDKKINKCGEKIREIAKILNSRFEQNYIDAIKKITTEENTKIKETAYDILIKFQNFSNYHRHFTFIIYFKLSDDKTDTVECTGDIDIGTAYSFFTVSNFQIYKLTNGEISNNLQNNIDTFKTRP